MSVSVRVKTKVLVTVNWSEGVAQGECDDERENKC